MKQILAAVIGALLLGAGALQMRPLRAAEVMITVYKSPTCGCCSKWENHLRDNGFKVESRSVTDVDSVKARLGVRREHASCHTGWVNGYFIEGHVPATEVRRLLREKPKGIGGISVPGMPMGSPGMEGLYSEPYRVLAIGNGGEASVYRVISNH